MAIDLDVDVVPGASDVGVPAGSAPPPSLFDALAAPDSVAEFAAGHQPRADVLPLLLIAAESARLSAAGRVDAMTALARYRASLEAAELRLISEMARGDTSSKEYARDEVAAALHISPMTARARMEFASTLHARFGETVRQLEAGTITVLHARVLVEATNRLAEDADARRVEAVVLPRAAGQTVGEFRRAAERAVLKVDAAQAEHRHELAMRERRIAFRAAADGMAELYGYLPLTQAVAAKARIDALAAATDPADGRTSDQRRADVLGALLTSEHIGGTRLPREQGMRPAVNVTVSVKTLAGASDAPGEIDGFGPIPAFLARRIAADPTGTWRRLVTDPTGRVLDYGRSTYRPPADLARFVIARDRTCCFPGCARRAARCDLDHCRDWAAGGRTSAANVYALCARHHQLKSETTWRYQPLPDGDLVWTSPTGHVYRRRPPPRDDDEPPF
jgi:hypothetical protein